MIRVLHVIGAMDRAGAETMIMNYYRAMDRNKIQFDFLVHTDRTCDYDEEIEALGGKIYRIPRFTGVNYLQYKAACKQFFESHPEIDIVHGHIESSASIYLPEAHRAGLVTVCHSHQSKGPLSFFEIAFRLATFRNKRSADYFMAPSEQAGIDRFGDSVVNSDTFFVLNNAIDFKRFDHNEEERAAAKSALGMTGKPVFGHVGRFTNAKNHPFLIEVFEKIAEKRPDAQLILVGRGENEAAIRKLVLEKGLEESIHFLGTREDVGSIMAAMDVFLFPSLWEGLGVVAIEAQASGLPCVLSNVIPKEAVLLPTTKQLPLSDSSLWAEAALDALESSGSDDNTHQIFARQGYDIEQAASWLEAKYINLSARSTKRTGQ